MTLKTRLYIWFLDRHILHVQPWEDPRRSPEDRAAWIQAEPKSLGRVG